MPFSIRTELAHLFDQVTGSTLYTLWDDTAITKIPKGAAYIGVYVDGRYRNVDQAAAAFPHARLFTITVAGSPAADCADCEPGAMTVQQTVGWVAHANGEGRIPWVYGSRDNLPQLLMSLEGDHYIWSAHYGVGRHVCGPKTCGWTYQADATQWTDHADGTSLDESVFGLDPGPGPAPAKPAGGVFEASVAVNIDGGWSIRPQANQVQLGGPDDWQEAKIGVNRKTGGWRISPLPAETK